MRNVWKWGLRIMPAILAISLLHPVAASTAANSPVNTPASKDIRITFNGSEFKPKSAPFVDKGVVYLPVQDMGELLNSVVSWSSSAQMVTLSYPELSIKLNLR